MKDASSKTKATPAAPKCLSVKSRKIWHAIHREYELEPESIELFRVALENLDLGDASREILRQEGCVLGGKPHPALSACKLHDGAFLRALRQLGLDIIAPGSGPAGRRQ
jgi:hypothetical protein